MMAEFRDLIRKHRYQQGWTQGQLASKLGTNQTQVSQWETGREYFGAWTIRGYFDRLLAIFDYPEDMIIWWVEQQLTEIEQTTTTAHEYRKHASWGHGPADVLAKLDNMIEQNRRLHADLVDLRDQLKEAPNRSQGMDGVDPDHQG